MLYSRHLVIVEIFSWNQSHHSQTIIEKLLYSEQFLALREKFKPNLPIYSRHPTFFVGK